MKHRTVSTGISQDAKGIHIVIAVSDQDGSNVVYLSGLETMEMIEKLRLLVKDVFDKSTRWSPEDWK